MIGFRIIFIAGMSYLISLRLALEYWVSNLECIMFLSTGLVFTQLHHLSWQILSSPWRIVQAEHSQSSVYRIVRDCIWLKGWHRMAPTWCLSHTKSDSRAVWTLLSVFWQEDTCLNGGQIVALRMWLSEQRDPFEMNQTENIGGCLFLPLHAGRGGIASDAASWSANDELGRRARTYVL